MRKPLTSLVALAFVLNACSGHATVVGGESVRPPEPPQPVFEVTVVAGDDLTPVAARIDLHGLPYTLDGTGTTSVVWQEAWEDEPPQMTVTAAGFLDDVSEIAILPEEGAIEIRLDPVILRGSVSTSDGRPLPSVTVALGATEVATDSRGDFTIVRAAAGTLELSRPAWEPTTEAWGRGDNRSVLDHGTANDQSAAGERAEGRGPCGVERVADACEKHRRQRVRCRYQG